MSVSVLLADDHPIVRQGLRKLLEAEPDFKIIGEASDGLEAVQLTERLKPDVLVLDLMMPGLNGMEVTRQVTQRSPGTRVIILSMHSNEAYVLQALRNGASGYVLKDSDPMEFVEGVREVISGRRYLSSPLSERLIDAFVSRTEETRADAYDTLTDREREVLQLTAEGCTSTEIGSRLSISPRTAEKHRASMMSKLRLRSQTEVIRYALKRGILPMDE